MLAAFERDVIFGAVALNLQGLARATLDLVVLLAPEKANVERLKAALRHVFDEPHVDEITAEDLLGDYPAVQYVPPRGTFHVDVLTRLGEAYRFEDLAARTTRPRFPPGVYKHRSVEEADALQQEWDRANFEAFHARRRGG